MEKIKTQGTILLLLVKYGHQWPTQEFCSGEGGSTISDEDRDREKGDLWDGASGGSCNLTQVISFHRVTFS